MTDPADQARHPEDALYPNRWLFPGMPPLTTVMDPGERQAVRAATLKEIPHPELGNGIRFTSTTTVKGVVSFGWRKISYDLNEITRDGSCITKDWDLAAVLRGLGLTELQL